MDIKIKYILKRKHINAFTLTELSIVIVIISLIVAGVSAGSSMVRSFQLQRLVADANTYKTAINTFKIQYNYYPGDLPNAQSYWATTQNGNGDGKIFRTGSQNHVERLLLWQHLTLASLIPGAYTGTDPNPYAGQAIVGVNVPKGAKPNRSGNSGDAGYDVYYNNWWGEISTQNYIFFGSYRGAGSLDGAAISPLDAYNLDKKFDDNGRYTGKMGILNGTLPGGSFSTNCFNLSYTSDQCILFFKLL